MKTFRTFSTFVREAERELEQAQQHRKSAETADEARS